MAPELLTGEMSVYLIDGDDTLSIVKVLHQAVTNRRNVRAEMCACHRARFARAVMTESWLKASG